MYLTLSSMPVNRISETNTGAIVSTIPLRALIMKEVGRTVPPHPTKRRRLMIEIMTESAGNVLGVRLTGKVTDDDYETVFIPALEKKIAEHGKARIVYYMDSEFEGWNVGAMWDDAKFGLKHRNDFEKIGPWSADRLGLSGEPSWRGIWSRER